MKKTRLMSLVMTLLVCLGFNLANAQFDGGLPTTAIAKNTVTRITTQAPGVPGYTNAPVLLTLSGQVGTYNLSSSQQLYINDSRQYNGTYQKVKISFENGSLYSIGTYYLPTAINGETNIGVYNEPWLTNYQGQYGYATTIKKIGDNQYTIKVTRLECNGCTPPGNPN